MLPCRCAVFFHRFILGLALFLIVLGAKLWLVQQAGSDLPFRDQWDAEGNLLVHYCNHQLSIREFFQPHNEHRILWTRLLALSLLALNRQWDARLEMTANAVLHSLAAVWLEKRFSMGDYRRKPLPAAKAK